MGVYVGDDCTDGVDLPYNALSFDTLMRGLTLTSISVGGEAVTFTTSDGGRIIMLHMQDCCEDVHLNEIIGDLDDLIGEPLLLAEEVVSDRGDPAPKHAESWTWTFYKLATRKGYVTLRWLGESSGYYSESVDMCIDAFPEQTLMKLRLRGIIA